MIEINIQHEGEIDLSDLFSEQKIQSYTSHIEKQKKNFFNDINQNLRYQFKKIKRNSFRRKKKFYRLYKKYIYIN